MKKTHKAAISFVFLIILSLFAPHSVLAASAGSLDVSVYIPSGTPFTTERIIYNAVTAAGGSCTIEQRHSGIDALKATSGRYNAVAAGVSMHEQAENAGQLSRVQTPVGQMEYTAFAREENNLILSSWQELQNLRVGVLPESDYALSQLESPIIAPDYQSSFANLADGLIDVFVAPIYNDVLPAIPEGIVVAGVVDASPTYLWYNTSQPEIGALLNQGLAAIQENGVLEQILAQKSVDPSNPKVVFQLSSYSAEMVWESQAEETLRATLGEYSEPVSLYIQNMNFRQTNFRSAQYEATNSFVRATFMREFPDVIIAMDNDALAYLQENYNRLFQGVPVVFCGINSYNEGLISNFAPYATGISEYINPTQTVEFALRANPGINRIHTIFDATSSASPVKASLQNALLQKYGSRMDITTTEGQTFNEIVAEVQSFDKNTMVLIGTYFADKNGRFMRESEVAEKLCSAVDIPVYSLMSGYLGYGVVGGRVAYSRSFIAEAAHMAMRILDGEAPSNIPIVNEFNSEARFNTFIVDKQAAGRFGIGPNLYSDAAIVLNDGQNIFEAYPVQSTAGVALLCILLVATVLCLLLIRSKRLRDIATQSASDEKEQNRMKSDFLARMSHEIRTPLNAIIGMDELILRDDISESTHRNAMIIMHSGRNLLSIINDILDFSKIESGKMELISNNYDVGSLIYDTVSVTRARLMDKPIQVKMDISPAFPAYLYGDETRVRQILLNLLTNSAKYTHEGAITLKAEFEFDTEEKTAGTAVFTVTDTGIGIKQDDIDRLFAAFTQVDTQNNRKVEGTGLGLAITQTLVELMEGSISVTSEYGEGSVFTVRLRQQIQHYKPLENASEAFSSHLEHEGHHKGVRFVAPTARVLAVDDVEANLLVVSGLLAPYKVKVDTVFSGVDAIDALLAKEYDLVLMDHMMPGMDGVETTKKIRSFGDERLRTVPIVALTANAIVGMRELFLESGFDDYIAKPIEIDALDKVMHTWIPKEKQQSFEPQESAKPEGGLRNLEGINVSKGLQRFGGKVDLYERILRSFAKSVPKILEELSGAYEKDNFDELRICVHSIKGIAGNVDCSEIYELCLRLEAAIHEPDYAFVHENVPLLIRKAEKIAQNIEEMLGVHSAVH